MKKAVLIVHGFVGSLYDNEYLMNYLEFDHKFDVFAYTLPGHHPCYDYQKVNYQTWIDFLNQRIQELINMGYKSVYLIGHSMGAIIAAHLASMHSVKKLILLSPAYYFGSLKQNEEDLKNIFKSKKGDTGFEGCFSKMKHVSLRSFMEYIKLSHIGRHDISNITCPVLIMHGDKDPVIRLKSSEYVLKKLKSKKEFVLIKDVRHQLFKSAKKEMISKYIYDYICGGIRYFVHKRKEI